MANNHILANNTFIAESLQTYTEIVYIQNHANLTIANNTFYDLAWGSLLSIIVEQFPINCPKVFTKTIIEGNSLINSKPHESNF